MSHRALGALIPTFGEDVVAIFEQKDDGNDVRILEQANIIRASIDEMVTFYKHPLENGRKIVDHRIIEPVTIEFRMLLIDDFSVLGDLITGDFVITARDVYRQIRQLFLDGTILSIQTRTHTYRNQILQSMPHEETSKIFDGVALTFNSSELQFETDNVTFAPARDADGNTIQRGKQNPLALSVASAALVAAEAGLIFGAV